MVISTPDQRHVEAWRGWFDEARTPIAEALSIFQIDCDPGEDDDEVVPYTSFQMRPRQRDALGMIERRWKAGRAAKIICLKSRRYGYTTFCILLGLERILRVPGYRVMLVAQDDVMARVHFARVRSTLQQIPKWVLAERGITVIRDTENQIILRHGLFRESEFRVAPAKRNALGRGDRFNMLVLTELPQWPKAAKGDLSGILQACRNSRGNLVIFESTARGYEEFQRRYVRAVKRRSDYRAMFIASFEHPGNRKKFESAEAETKFIASIGTEAEYGGEDETILFRRLTVDLKWTFHDAAEFLNWRRSDIVDECDGIVSNHKRENPNTPDEAFQGTGIPIFRKDVIEAWRSEAEAREEKARRGRLVVEHDVVKFIDDPAGEVTVFEEPDDNERYGFGADVASGIETHADGRTEADFSVGYFGIVGTKKVCARFRAHIAEDEFGVALFHLACWYFGARGYIERQANAASVVIGTFEEQSLGEYDGTELLLGQKRKIKSDFTNQRANYKHVPGFVTSPKTKPELISNIRVLVKATGLPEPGKECPFDLLFIDEGMKFERVGSTGRMEAASGHDDCVMAEGLFLEACKEIEKDPEDEKPPQPKKGSHMVLLRHMQAQAQQGLEDEELTEVPGLPGF